jgi:predicted GNAT superfamily acetyltransferase
VHARATLAADRAMRRAGVEIREVTTVEECKSAGQLLAEVWQSTSPPVPHDLMRAVQHAGGYVFGAYDDASTLQAVSLGFRGVEGLHSHITGVVPRTRRHGLGFALKQHQRAWALEHDVDVITWTCDPLVRRNVAFNLHALGASVTDYLPNHYGAMTDGINAQDESDRFELRWDLTSPRAIACSEDRLPYLDSAAPAAVSLQGELPVLNAVPGPARRVQLPEDIEGARSRSAAAGRAWRHAVRDAVLPALRLGAAVTGLTPAGELVLA